MSMKVEFACSWRARLRGLAGREGFDSALALVPCHDVHTYTMKRPIDVAFVAPDGMVVESHRRIGPKRRLRNRHAAFVIERFASPDPWPSAGDRIELGCWGRHSDPIIGGKEVESENVSDMQLRGLR